jgi:hypothetical protein
MNTPSTAKHQQKDQKREPDGHPLIEAIILHHRHQTDHTSQSDDEDGYYRPHERVRNRLRRFGDAVSPFAPLNLAPQ